MTPPNLFEDPGASHPALNRFLRTPSGEERLLIVRAPMGTGAPWLAAGWVAAHGSAPASAAPLSLARWARTSGSSAIQRMLALGTPPGAISFALITTTVHDVEWVDIEDPDPANAALDPSAVFRQGLEKGGAIFQRLEGCWYGDGSIFRASPFQQHGASRLGRAERLLGCRDFRPPDDARAAGPGAEYRCPALCPVLTAPLTPL